MSQLLQEWIITIKDFALDNPEWSLAAVTGMTGTLGATGRWLVLRFRRSPSAQVLATSPAFPFDVIKPHSQRALPIVMGATDQDSDNPLADCNIPYQPRREDLRVRQQIEGYLDVHRWLLVLGRTGLGKTREAAELAGRLNNEGWTVLKLKNAELLTVPTEFPAEILGPQPKLLIVLDNLNQAMVLGNIHVTSKSRDDLSASLQQPLPDRLLATLEFYERACGTDRLRVIATARNETVPELGHSLSQWDMLAIDQYPQFWGRFHRYLLPEPSPRAIEAVLSEVTQKANLRAKRDEFGAIAECNDGTFRNVVENLERAKNRQLILSRQNYKETLSGTWDNRYQAAISRDCNSRCLYDAIDLLRQCNVELRDLIVLATAAMLTQRSAWWQLWQRHQLKHSLHNLNQRERILQPRDGQIEAKGNIVDPNKYLGPLSAELIGLSRREPKTLPRSLAGFIGTAIANREYQLALPVAERLIELAPRADVAWFYKGFLLVELKRSEDAITAYDAALVIQPDNYRAFWGKGVALVNLGRYEDAVAAYDAALEIKPDYHEALNSKGNALGNLGRYEDAITAYDAALEIKPDYHEVLYNKGVALGSLRRYEDAITAYDAALEIKPDYHEALNNKGNALGSLRRYEDAITAYDAALEIKPDYHEALNNKGVALGSLRRYEDAITAYDAALEIKPDYHEVLYNKGLALGKLGRYEDAIIAYDAALNIQPNSTARFGRANIIRQLERYKGKFEQLFEDITTYEQALEIEPHISELLSNKKVALENSEHYLEILALYGTSLLLNPEKFEALHEQGLTLSELGYFQAAICAYNAALIIQPEYYQSLYNKAICHSLLGDLNPALEALRQAIELFPKCRDMAKTNTYFDAIRDDPRFQALLAGEK
jgi:tetratricopeptide (TPR) repeat protein